MVASKFIVLLLFAMFSVVGGMIAIPGLSMAPTPTTMAYAQIGTVPPTLGTTQPPPLNMDPSVVPQLAAQDPSFAAFEQLRKSCENAYLYGNSTMTSAQCDTSLQQGVTKWCGLDAYHPQKCEWASFWAGHFSSMNNALQAFGGEGFGIDDLLGGGGRGLLE
jgi:hypothetical protein